MAREIALAQHHTARLPLQDLARSVIVAGCALALVLAGPAFPLF